MPKPLTVATVLAAIILSCIVGYNIAPEERSGSPDVTRQSAISYKIGEKVKVNPYGGWLDGKVIAITSEDDYIVRYCGPIDWFNKWKCEERALKRSEMAKISEGKS